jgi:hypothetical protein
MMNARMDQLNKLANQANKTDDEDLKRIWTNKWYQLCRKYGNEIREKYEKEKK